MTDANRKELEDQIKQIKQRLEASRGTPAETTFQTVLATLEQRLAELFPEEEPEAEKLVEEKPPSFFQAIAHLQGRILPVEEDGKTHYYVRFKILPGKEFFIFIPPDQLKIPRYKPWMKKSSIESLLNRQEELGNEYLWLTVYPQVQFEDRENCKIYFRLVAWRVDSPMGEEKSQLFILRGIWQFIPQYKRPVLSVYRNQQKYEMEKISTVHVPLFWKNSTVKPYRPKPPAKNKDKDKNKDKNTQQDDKYFVQVLARFMPDFNSFKLIELIDKPTTEIPKHLKPKFVNAKIEKLKLKKQQELEEKNKQKQKDEAKAEENLENIENIEALTPDETIEQTSVTEVNESGDKSIETAQPQTDIEMDSSEVKSEDAEATAQAEAIKEEPVDVIVEKQEAKETIPDTEAETSAATPPEAQNQLPSAIEELFKQSKSGKLRKTAIVEAAGLTKEDLKNPPQWFNNLSHSGGGWYSVVGK